MCTRVMRMALAIIVVIGLASNAAAIDLEGFEKKAADGDILACLTLGAMYDKGQGGVSQDFVKAMALYRKAAEQKNGMARYLVGTMYEESRGVAKDEAQAAKWYREAADQGELNAQLRLGRMYAEGRGVAKDKVAAYMWLELAANKESKDAKAERDRLATGMTPEQIEEGKRQAQQWQAAP